MNLPTATASYHQRTDGNTNPQEENFTRQDEQQIRNRSQSAGDNLTLICLRPQQAIIIVLMGPHTTKKKSRLNVVSDQVRHKPVCTSTEDG